MYFLLDQYPRPFRMGRLHPFFRGNSLPPSVFQEEEPVPSPTLQKRDSGTKASFTVLRLGILCKGTVWSKPKLSIVCHVSLILLQWRWCFRQLLFQDLGTRRCHSGIHCGYVQLFWVAAIHHLRQAGQSLLAVHARTRLVSVPDPN